jgi:hypothetical protein
MTVYLSQGLRKRLDIHQERTGIKASTYIQRLLNSDLKKQELRFELKGK